MFRHRDPHHSPYLSSISNPKSRESREDTAGQMLSPLHATGMIQLCVSKMIPFFYSHFCGQCFLDDMPETTMPEMQRVSLTWVVLQLKALGIDDILHFDFV